MKLRTAAYIIGKLGGRPLKFHDKQPLHYHRHKKPDLLRRIRAGGFSHDFALLLEDGTSFLLLEDLSFLLLE